MNSLIIFGIVIQVFVSVIFFRGLQEKHRNGESITFEVVLLLGMYIPVVILLTFYFSS